MKYPTKRIVMIKSYATVDDCFVCDKSYELDERDADQLIGAGLAKPFADEIKPKAKNKSE